MMSGIRGGKEMFIGFKDMFENYIINTDNIESIEEEEDIHLTYESYGIIITMTSGEEIVPEWEKESDRDKMMSYLYGQLVQPKLKIGEPNRFFDVTEL